MGANITALSQPWDSGGARCGDGQRWAQRSNLGQHHPPHAHQLVLCDCLRGPEPSGVLFPRALEDGHCLQNIPWCPLCESRALRTEKGRKVEQVAVEMLPVWGSRGFSGAPVSASNSGRLSCRCCLIIKILLLAVTKTSLRNCFWVAGDSV